MPIEIYFVKKFKDNEIAGISYTASVVPDAKYADSIVMKGVTDDQTLAHEVGHILLNSGDHVPGFLGYIGDFPIFALTIVNLMAAPHKYLGEITDSRRITAAQANAMLKNRPNLVLPPKTVKSPYSLP